MPAVREAVTIAPQNCGERVNDTLTKLEACIQRKTLWSHLSQFQLIADENPGPKGHGNRDVGTSGYRASVAYVAKLMRNAGYKVTIQQYNYKKEAMLPSRDGDIYRARFVDRLTAPVNFATQGKNDIDYNVIADSPFGNPHHVVVIDAHLDSIYGAGMLDNASGSTTILDIALSMARTRTLNHLRYIWFGGEEVGLLGSRYYTTHLASSELQRILFDVDVDVTATPNFDILVADPKFASRVKKFPPNVVPQSKVGNELFADFFQTGGVVSRPARFGDDGTDSLSFSLVGVPNSGILTQQDCCKHTWETRLWGGVRGNYEGKIPSFNGGCVDYPRRWCDNLYNNDSFVLELVSKAVAYVTFELAGHHFTW